MQLIDFEIPEFNNLQTDLTTLNYLGNTTLLSKRKVSIVGTRRPSHYTQNFTHLLAQGLSQRNIIVVSGAAMGVDGIAHKAVKESQTIAVVANGLDIRYPRVNSGLIKEIEQKGLMLSQFEKGYEARAYSFVQRNELVVALGEVLIITEASLNSGSMRSAEFAIKQNKKIYVLPHRLGESQGTQQLINQGLATPIYDIDSFLNNFGHINTQEDEILTFCKGNQNYESAYLQFGEKLLEYELEGKLLVNNGIITIIE